MSEHAPTDPAILRAEIAQTRTELGETLEALAARTNVRARSREAVRNLAGRATDAIAAVGGHAVGAASGVAGLIRSATRSTRSFAGRLVGRATAPVRALVSTRPDPDHEVPRDQP